MHIVHIQCLLRVDGSTLAGVFLTSSFCVVPESSYSSNEASGSLLVAWYTQTLVAPSQQCMASFQTSALEVATELAVVHAAPQTPMRSFQTHLDYSYSP